MGKQSQLLLKPTEVELGLQVGVEFDKNLIVTDWVALILICSFGRVPLVIPEIYEHIGPGQKCLWRGLNILGMGGGQPLLVFDLV